MPRIGISARLKDVMIATLNALTAIVLVNPVPWARAQMAFTLGFHIILVPLGVSWAFMTLIANYRGLRHSDGDALVLAQRWSKFMAVTFAVGAVTGTVLTFEFGLLGAFLDRGPDRPRGHLRQHFGGRGERLDERTFRVRAGLERKRGQRRPRPSDLQ